MTILLYIIICLALAGRAAQGDTTLDLRPAHTDAMIVSDLPAAPRSYVVTDSIVWVSLDTLHAERPVAHIGPRNDVPVYGVHWHHWVYGDSTRAGGFCAVMHNGAHCDDADIVRTRICRECLLSIRERERWYQHRVELGHSEFDSLKALLPKVTP